MKALSDFLSTDYGLMSLAVIAITIGMGAFFYRFFKANIERDAAAAKQQGR